MDKSPKTLHRPDIATIHTLDSGSEVHIQGRITSIRESRNFVFVDLQDWSGKMQLCFDKNTFDIPENLLTLGNIITTTGKLNLSRTKEKTIFVTTAHLLSECILPIGKKQIALPEAADRFRNRLLDGIQHPEILAFFATIARTKLALRTQLAASGFVECDTGILHDRFDAGLARPFKTYGNAVDRDLYLRLTAELHLKRLLIAGFTNVFELGPSFRNEGMNAHYNPEFTLLEAYTTSTDLTGLKMQMRMWTQNAILVSHGTSAVTNDVHTINFAGLWPEIPFFSALSDITGKKLNQYTPHNELVAALASQDAGEYHTGMPAPTLLLKAANQIIAPRIIQPTYLTDIPSAACSPFVVREKDNEQIAQSSWLAIDGMIVGDLYNDDNNPDSLGRKLEAQNAISGGTINTVFLEQLTYGLAPSAGMGIGLNRLFLAMRPQGIRKDIKETLSFPLLK